MKFFIILIFFSCLLLSCSTTDKHATYSSKGGIVPKPDAKSDELRPGEKLNMMLLMQAESASEDMDEVIVTPPKESKVEKKQLE